MPTDDLSSEEFELRPGFRDDLYTLPEVFLAAVAAPDYPSEERTPAQIRAWCLGLLDAPGRELWLAVRGDTVLGFLLLDGQWVNLIFVHPDRPARGVGLALLDLVKGLRPHGFGLRVYQSNARARAFYRKHGLVELEETDGSSYEDAQPDLQMAWLGDDPMAYLRGRIDSVDDELAVLLARRTALTAAVQDHKAASGSHGGRRGRDADREAEIVARMARHVPGLGPERIARLMHAIIEESLAAWEAGDGS
ncbi:MAG: putative acetyltransferase [Marmoricola sp.]|jgi:chorismate mutase/GNAT superfamily N-acetyltransferase|nr:putative acetyltransferase [Marmoricola sp.]